MKTNLVIVESPAKSKTIEKYLGEDFQVLASYGHVRDLLKKEGAVDPEKQFAMKYEVVSHNKKHLKTISDAIKTASNLYLATDPDREGEAISWHLYELLNSKKLLKDKEVYRVVFNEITRSAIQDAMANPRKLSMDLINAQQARRALDHLVGFTLSPLLWKKIRRGLSAGRVQSPALRMIVEREIEIEKFIQREYWTITAATHKDEQPFTARLTHFQNKKLTQFSVENETQANAMKAELRAASNDQLQVLKIDKKQRKCNPAAPFTTSTLQQEASRKLGFGAQKTMITAQQLYEGIDIGGEPTGLISYMRTDSVTLANEAVAEIREFITKHYGDESLPKTPRTYKTKAKNAQEAHEAIRPTSIQRIPELLKAALNKDQFRLYELIWKRTIACQMMHATLNTVTIDLGCGADNIFRVTGSTIASPGFMAVYQEGIDDAKKDDSEGRLLPAMEPGDCLPLLDINTGQHFTDPPPRFTEASLVKTLEEYGIGRPSTYATIISTLQKRDYAILETKRFFPTDVGRVVIKFLTEHFTQYVDFDFTAKLEDELDAISRGEHEWVPVMENFWTPFNTLVKDKDKTVNRSDVTQEPIDEMCPTCGKQLAKRLGRGGLFIGCTAYPDCAYSRDMDGSVSAEPETIDRKCPTCESELIIRKGRYGKFIGCSAYPKCRYIEPLEKPVDTKVKCPQCDVGTILERKSKKGKIFFACSNYPKCKYVVWYPPLEETCPQCNWKITVLKTTKKNGVEVVCPQQSCSYSQPMENANPESKEDTE